LSTLLYSSLTTRRQEAPSGTSANAEAVDPGNDKAGKPPGDHGLDAAAALVPAEVLAHAFLITAVSESENNAQGNPTTVITNVRDAQILFWVLLGLALVLYVGAHMGSWRRSDFARMFIPPMAFFLRMILQEGTAFDAVADPREFLRYLVGVVGVIVVGLIAQRLAYKADQQPATG
jgi:hypothetical protein